MRLLLGREPHRLQAMRTEDPRIRGGQMSGQTHSQDRKAEVRAALQLDSEPDDEFMALLAEVGEGDVAAGPMVPIHARGYTPDEIEDVVINGTTGELLAQARGGRTLASIGEKVGVTRARIQQLERSTNIEIATFVRVAKACGYEVSVHLRPLHSDLSPLSAVLGAPDAT
jgi:hypothetical protein